MKRSFTVKPKQSVTAAESTRSRISNLERHIAALEEELQMPYLDEDRKIDIQMELQELNEQLNFAWQDDEAEYNYALEQQEFNPDGSLKYYDEPDSEWWRDEGANMYTVKIWHEAEPSGDTTYGPVAQEEFFDFVAASPQDAIEYAKKAWQGPIDRIAVVAIDGEPMNMEG